MNWSDMVSRETAPDVETQFSNLGTWFRLERIQSKGTQIEIENLFRKSQR